MTRPSPRRGRVGALNVEHIEERNPPSDSLSVLGNALAFDPNYPVSPVPTANPEGEPETEQRRTTEPDDFAFAVAEPANQVAESRPPADYSVSGDDGRVFNDSDELDTIGPRPAVNWGIRFGEPSDTLPTAPSAANLGP